MDTRTKPTLPGRVVTLRPITSRDTDAMWAMVQDEAGNRLTGTQRSFTREEIARWCEACADAEGRVDLAIVATSDGRFLGEVVLNEIDETNRSANFRISLSGPRNYGRGYGSEATRLMLEYGFERLNLHRIGLEVFAFNDRALHVYEKLGFRREGVLREVLFQDGRYHDAIVMSQLRHEYGAAQPAVEVQHVPVVR